MLLPGFLRSDACGDHPWFNGMASSTEDMSIRLHVSSFCARSLPNDCVLVYQQVGDRDNRCTCTHGSGAT
jgi:hypothetical protein